MPNLRGASPVSRDKGGRSYIVQTVSRGGSGRRHCEHQGAEVQGEGTRARGTRGVVGQARRVVGGMQGAAGTGMVDYRYEFGGLG